MTLEDWAKDQNLSWEKLARELSMITMRLTRNTELGSSGKALYSSRLWLLRHGKAKPRKYELMALDEITAGEVEAFYCNDGESNQENKQ